MNQSKNRSPRQWRLWRASGAVRTPSQPPDYDECLNAAVRYDMRGDHFMAGLMRVAAFNITQGCMDMKKPHCPNIGPYSHNNPKHCIHCGKPGVDWIEDEECIPVT